MEIQYEYTDEAHIVNIGGVRVEDNWHGFLVYLPTPSHLKSYRVHQSRKQEYPTLCKFPNASVKDMSIVPYSQDAEGNWVEKSEMDPCVFRPGSLEHAAFELAVELKKRSFSF